ncbi:MULTISPECIES: MATE family efflux transporter [unclassified Fusibacter]|uniref:MATE family efflux transporter n=1 Tax=unclassified Fusibacter TaxID=2624464 RepID=UPI001010F6CA|nr:MULTISPECIES: MATE family efflux transporter [unclassified Fusibacter]MCK8058932.1 MATE family efflux transporter [Fusibacter sp. A2]NPE22008.1 MATE family efflux transporter [Fusibacter sp. A1]RXV61573.1 MATE family efflux transporter [Fusibacter sp. A1]
MRQNEQLLNEPVGKLLWKYSLPAIIGMMVNALYNVVDRIYIGKLGPLPMTGIGLSMPLMTLLMGFGMLVGIGAGARVSIRLGQNNKELAERILGNAVTLLILIMGSLSVLGLIFKLPLLRIFGASDVTIGFADQYLTVILIGAIFQGLGFGLNSIVRSEGSPKIAMYTVLIGAIVNIILDPILIFGFGMGIQGAAVATVFSQLLTATWVLMHFTSSKSKLKLKLKNLVLDGKTVLSILSIGMSPFSMQVAASVVTILANNALKATGGDLAISAMTVINAIAIFFLMPIFGINQGSQPIIGFNYGAKAFDRVKKTLLLAILAGTALSSFGFLLTQFWTTGLISLFNNDPALVDLASKGMKLFLSMLPVIGFQIISANYFQAVGKAPKAMFLSLLRQVLVLIPLLILLPQFIGLTGVWLAGPTADFTASVVTAIFLFNELRHLEDSHEGIQADKAILKEEAV